MLVFVQYDARWWVRKENTSLSTCFLLTPVFFQCTVTGEQAATALQHNKAEICWKKTSCTYREVHIYIYIIQGDLDIIRRGLLEAVPLTELLALEKKLRKVSSVLSVYFLNVYVKIKNLKIFMIWQISLNSHNYLKPSFYTLSNLTKAFRKDTKHFIEYCNTSVSKWASHSCF